ncbi:unnamed protein product, partial [Prorocentrum cordatum]
MFKTTCDCCLAVQSDRIFFVWAPCRGAGHSNAAPHSAKCHCRNSSCVDCDRSASWWQVGMGPAGYALQCGAGCGEAARAPGCGVHATAGKPLGGGWGMGSVCKVGVPPGSTTTVMCSKLEAVPSARSLRSAALAAWVAITGVFAVVT